MILLNYVCEHKSQERFGGLFLSFTCLKLIFLEELDVEGSGIL